MFEWFKKLFKSKNKPEDAPVFVIPEIKPLDEYDPAIRKLALVPQDLNEFANSLVFDNDVDLELCNFSQLSKEAKLKIREIVLEDYKKLKNDV